MKYIWRSLVLLTLILSLVACAGPEVETPKSTEEIEETEETEQGEEVSEESKLIYSNGGPQEFFETPWLNPGSYTYNKALYAHLIVADENLNPIPGHPDALATYEYSEDGKTLTFTLRDDAYWHDGEKITPEDIKWSIEYATKTPVLNSVFMSTFNAIEGSESGAAETFNGIAIDGNNIVITFEKIAPDALLTFTQFAPLPKKHFEGIDPLQFQQAPYFQAPVGSGPFAVDEVEMNNYTILKPFDQYYNGVADFNFYLTPSPGDSDANLVNNAKSGLFDFGYTKNIADVQSLEGTPGLNIHKVNVRYTRLFYPNKFDKADGTPSPVADPRVRQAILYAIDMEAITEGLFNGAAVPANSLTPDENLKSGDLNDYQYDPEKARELLAEADWDPDTELDVVYYYTDQLTVDLMTAIQAYLSDVGIKMSFRLVEGDLASILWTAPEDQVNGPSAVDWDLAYAANAALSLHEYYDRYRTGSPTNSHTPADETLNELIDATNASAKVEDQNEAFKELIQYENETLFTMALYYQPIFVITSDRIGDIKVANVQFNYDWDVQNWEIYE